MEFFNDEQRAAHVAALKREREGYEKRLELARDDENSALERRLTKRVAAVDGELARLGELEAANAEKRRLTKRVAAVDGELARLGELEAANAETVVDDPDAEKAPAKKRKEA